MENIEQLAKIWAGFLTGRVFYLPILGPIFTPDRPIANILSALLLNSQTNEFLPYDKNSRWHKSSPEKIILSSIIAEESCVCLPVRNTFKKNTLKLFYYKHDELNKRDLERAMALFQQLNRVEQIDSCFLYYFNETKKLFNAICHQIYLKQITEDDLLPSALERVFFYEQLPEETKKTFADLGLEPELEGFAFLWRDYLSSRKMLSPIVCCVEKSQIIGAIGPIDINKDAWDISYLLAPYFGIKKKYRGLGYSSKLWQAAIDFAYRKEAKYTLVQNMANSRAASFYEEQGLTMAVKFYSAQLK